MADIPTLLYSKRLVLREICQAEKPLTARKISHRVNITQENIRNITSDLLALGLVEGERIRLRVVIFRPTELGRQVFEEIARSHPSTIPEGSTNG